MSRAELAALLLVFAVAIALRLIGLGDASFWYDEMLTVHSAAVPLKEVVTRVRLSENCPPLYFILTNAWTKFAGISEVSLRLPSALIGTATVAGLYWMCRGWYGRVTALTAAGLLALSPFHLAYSQEARTYALLLLLLLLCTWTFLRLMETGSGTAQAGYVVAAVLAMYAHTFAVFALAALNLFYAWRWLRRAATGVSLRQWITLQLAVAVLFGPWIPATIEVARMGLPWIVRAPFHVAFTSYAGSSVGAVLAGLLVVSALRRGWLERDDRVVLLLLLLIVPVVAPWIYGPFTARYGIVSLFALVVLCAYGAAQLGPWAAAGLVILAAAGWGITSEPGEPRYPGYTQKPDVRAIASHLAEHARPCDAYTLTWAPLLQSAYDYYSKDKPFPCRRLDGLEPAAMDGRSSRIWMVMAEPGSVPSQIAQSGYQVGAQHQFDGAVLLELYPAASATNTLEPSPAPGRTSRPPRP